ncbi:hypothetical protein ACN2MM_12620 [Alkalilimnicola ehrlichii MLHE-1]|uniref:Uncharacterized protein n=2 Tax=Alkalilimnicola ehrlichii TaxID=351052 RepID=Q0A626_ALKEH|nr:hypothetical protein [Alkalilimnicola ehrlichii]ABI57711.1 hypothetical protein Mlg_2371 [Alkalilimnicola ehrlichii MLHE-1]
MRKRREMGGRLEYHNGFTGKLIFFGLLLLGAVSLLVAVPSGGILSFVDDEGMLIRESPIGAPLSRHPLRADSLSGAVLRESRARRERALPAPPGVRVELQPHSGEPIPLTLHHGALNRRSELQQIQRAINAHLDTPRGAFTVRYQDHRYVLAVAGLLGGFALYGLLWGAPQRRLAVDRVRDRLSLGRRWIWGRRQQDWPLARIDHTTLQVRYRKQGRQRQVRPLLVLRDGTTVPILKDYSGVAEKRHRAMLSDIEQFAGLPFRAPEEG